MSRVVIRLALDPHHWRAQDRALWARQLAGAAETAAPAILQIEGYELGDTMLRINARSPEAPKRLHKLLREHESLRRLRARLGDLGARPDFDVDGDGA